MNLSKEVKVTKVVDYTAAGTSTITSTEVDMEGFEGVVFIASIGTAATDNGIKARQDTVTGMGSAQDLLGTQILSDGTETDFVLDIVKPREQFVDCQVIRATSTTIESVYAIQYGAKTVAVDNDSPSTQAAETHVSPAEGTA